MTRQSFRHSLASPSEVREVDEIVRNFHKSTRKKITPFETEMTDIDSFSLNNDSCHRKLQHSDNQNKRQDLQDQLYQTKNSQLNLLWRWILVALFVSTLAIVVCIVGAFCIIANSYRPFDTSKWLLNSVSSSSSGLIKYSTFPMTVNREDEQPLESGK